MTWAESMGQLVSLPQEEPHIESIMGLRRFGIVFRGTSYMIASDMCNDVVSYFATRLGWSRERLVHSQDNSHTVSSDQCMAHIHVGADSYRPGRMSTSRINIGLAPWPTLGLWRKQMWRTDSRREVDVGKSLGAYPGLVVGQGR